MLLPAAECGLDNDSKAQAEQVRSVGVGRLNQRAGALPVELLAKLDAALRTHLVL